MQAFTDIPDSQTLQASRPLLMDNDKTIMSCSSGTAFPTNNLQVGMLCYRTDQSRLYLLTNTTGPVWTEVRNLLATNWDSANFSPSSYAPLASPVFTGAPIVNDGILQIGPTAGSRIQIRNDGYLSLNGGTYTVMWTAANDGAGSGLDADVLDGQQGSFYTDIPARLGFTPVRQGGGAGQGTNTVYIGWSGSALKAQVDSTDLGTIWMSSNFTPSNYAALSGADFTGKVRGSAAGSFSAGPTFGLEAFAASGAATLAFHRSGAYAIVAGLDTDNIFKVGGWSDGANVFRMLLAQNYVQFNNELIMRGASPRIILRDTDHRTAFIYLDSNLFYVLRGAPDSSSWDSGPNGRHPMTLNLETGNVTFSGDITAFSDKRLKKNIKQIESATSKVLQMRGVEFQRIDSSEAGIGLVAQDVQQAFPSAVKKDSDGYLSVNYGGLIGPVIEAIRELNERLNKVENAHSV